MSRNGSVATANAALARQINDEARRDPASPYAGKLVGIGNGQVVVVADTWREVATRLRQAEPNPAKCYCIDASKDYDEIEDSWSAVSPFRSSA
jgi:hypothetical protein